jgi:hypothetical protein
VERSQARAVVVDVSESMSPWRTEAAGLAQAEMQGAIFASRIDAAELDDGLMLAVSRLESAPPARREIVVVSDFQQGALTHAAIDRVPLSIGIRLVQVGADPQARTVLGIELFGVEKATAQEVAISGTSTAVRVVPPTRPEGESVASASAGLSLATSRDSAAVRSLQRAVASAGAPAPSPQQPMTIAFAGASLGTPVRAVSTPWMLQTVLRLSGDYDAAEASAAVDAVEDRADSNPHTDPQAWHVVFRDRQSRPLVRVAAGGRQLVVHVAAPPSAFVSAAALRGLLIARQGSTSRPEDEVRRMAAAELTTLSRQGRVVTADDIGGAGADSDSRWCWGLVLVLLVVEMAARRQRDLAEEESRVDAA